MNCSEYLSVRWCKKNYGHYAVFAILRLHTAVIRHDRYGLSSFNWAFRLSGKDHKDDSQLRAFMENLDYADSHYFTTDELRFYIQAASSYRVPTDEEIEIELAAIERENEADMILDSHAEYLKKAVEYWRLHYREKLQVWRREHREADHGWILRRKLADGDIVLEEGVMAEDEGYFSEDEEENDENQ